jgi:O-antigen/teichoic acid export membrane protein
MPTLMNIRLGASATALAVPLVCEACALLRNLVLARMIGADEMGRLMVLALLLRLVEMGSDLSVERLMAQARDGGGLKLQRNLQGAALLRAVFMSLVILALSWPVARSLGDGPSAASFALLSLVPLVRGAMHLDYRRFERRLRFRTTLIVDGMSALVCLLSTPLAVAFIDDHRALIPLALLQALAAVMLSHAVAKRRFRLAFDTASLRRVWQFGGPLLLNGLLMFGVFQGDRMIVAFGYDWADIGRYAIAAQLALLPTQVLARAAQSLLLPIFREALADGALERSEARARYLFAGLAAFYLLGYGLLANPVFMSLYGEEYRVSTALLWGLAGMASLRVLLTPLSITAVALGRTSLPFLANLWRGGALLPAALVAFAGSPLHLIALCGAVGEAAAAIAAYRQTRAALGKVPHSTSLAPVAFAPHAHKGTIS